MILTFDQQQLIKPISPNNSAKYPQLATEVETLELQKLLGIAFLQDIQNNPETVDNLKLLNGATFTDCIGNTITHKGLRFVIAYLNYSEYLGSSYAVDTFTGFVKKKHENADALAEGEIKKLQSRNREIALNEFDVIKLFLDANESLYPLWNVKQNKELYVPRIDTLRKTAKDYSPQRIQRIND